MFIDKGMTMSSVNSGVSLIDAKIINTGIAIRTIMMINELKIRYPKVDKIENNNIVNNNFNFIIFLIVLYLSAII